MSATWPAAIAAFALSVMLWSLPTFAAGEVQSKLPRVQAAWLNVYQQHIGRLLGLSERLGLESMIGNMLQANNIVIGRSARRIPTTDQGNRRANDGLCGHAHHG